MSSNEWELFKFQAIRAAGLQGHPKAERLYADAWEMFGEYGKDEVLLGLVEMAEIVLAEEGKTV